MIITKDFDEFKTIVENIEERKILFRGSNFWQRYRLWIYSNDKIIIENDRIFIPFVAGKHHYKAEFERNTTRNFIKIKNSKLGALWYSFLNSYIANRIYSNWDISS